MPTHWTSRRSTAASILLAAALLLFHPRVTIAADDPAPLAGFDAYVQQAMRDWKIPGLAIAVVKDDRVVFVKGYGVRELGKPDRVDEHTLFAIGSTTKAMTAAAIGMLVDEGKVRWNDPVGTHLPAFQLSDPYVTRELMVRDLLTHRSGLGNADYLWYGADNSRAEILDKVRRIELTASLRSRFIYQNVMYAAAGEVVHEASGMSWDDFVRARIFEPLGMTDSLPTADKLSTRPNVAAPHFAIEDVPRVITNASVDAVAPAGSVWSSVSDMSRWMRAMLNGSRVPDGNGKALLKDATYAELFRPQMIVDADAFYPTAQLTHPHWKTYGLGWFQEDYMGRAVDFHTGSIDGMVAIIGLIRDEHLGVYVLSNLDHAELRHALMYKIFDLYGPGGSTRDWSAELLTLYGNMARDGEAAAKRLEEQRVAGTKPSLPLDKYAGIFTDNVRGRVEVSYANGALQLRQGSGFRATLEHWNYDTFRAIWDKAWLGKSFVTFSLDHKGDVAAMEVDQVRYIRLDPSHAEAAR